jgi:hypothetical protein
MHCDYRLQQYLLWVFRAISVPSRGSSNGCGPATPPQYVLNLCPSGKTAKPMPVIRKQLNKPQRERNLHTLQSATTHFASLLNPAGACEMGIGEEDILTKEQAQEIVWELLNFRSEVLCLIAVSVHLGRGRSVRRRECSWFL